MSNWIAFQIAGDEGLPLIFLHGLYGDAEQWRPQLDAFAGRYRAIAWDMPGYGDSAPLDEMTFPALATALNTLFDRLSLGQAHLVGHAMGAMVAQTFARLHPDRLRSLTLVASGASFGKNAEGQLDETWRQRFIERRLGPLDRGASLTELAPRIVQGLIGDRAEPKGLEQAILSLAAVPKSGYRAAVNSLADFDWETDIADIQTPTLLIAGEKDPISPPAMMARLADIIPKSRLEILPHCGHLANLEQPAAFNKALDDFLQSLVVH